MAYFLSDLWQFGENRASSTSCLESCGFFPLLWRKRKLMKKVKGSSQMEPQKCTLWNMERIRQWRSASRLEPPSAAFLASPFSHCGAQLGHSARSLVISLECAWLLLTLMCATLFHESFPIPVSFLPGVVNALKSDLSVKNREKILSRFSSWMKVV